ncbi:hypothetical protein BGZ49_002045 [Haplosporangium sp. Z 27]|nr:hypothetical protein BGZ49_002045 [Haplosporangium sp. Z 27]
MDLSLDEIIKAQRQDKKSIKTAPKKAQAGIQSRGAAIRARASARPYARPGIVQKETALFTESYKAAKAPVTEIFTAGYIPKPATTLKLFTTNYKKGGSEQNNRGEPTTGPLTTKPLRLVTTQPSKRGAVEAPNSKIVLTTQRNIVNKNSNTNHNDDQRIPAGPRSTGQQGSAGSSRGGDFYRPNDRNDRVPTSEPRSYQENRSQQVQPATRITQTKPASMDMDMDMDMDMGDGSLSFRGSAPNPSVTFRGESGPATIEIENLDPGTTADDVKFVCSKFGEIKSCICTNGFSQVTYARKAAGLAAIENLHGKKADNGKILRVTMRKNVILHDEISEPVPHVPSPIAGPMKILTKAVQGTITNAGTLYSDQLLAAQHMLKVQQHRMAQLHREEQRISSLRMQTEPQLSNLNSLSTSGVHRGFF